MNNGPKNVLILGASTGYGLASRITSTFACGAKTLGVFFDLISVLPKSFASKNTSVPLSVIAAMTLGIVVDDTIHFMSKYLRAYREQNLSPIEAVRYSFQTVGTAMWITTGALVAGFLVLSISGYKMNSDMGLMTAITITLALVLDFLLLPTLLMKLDKKNY